MASLRTMVRVIKYRETSTLTAHRQKFLNSTEISGEKNTRSYLHVSKLTNPFKYTIQ